MSFSQVQHCARATATGLATLLVVLLLLVLAGLPAQGTTADVTGSAWLSGPAEIWAAAMGGSDTSENAKLLRGAIKMDFTAAITALDAGADVTVSTLTPNTAPLSGPVYGAQATYTVTSTSLTVPQIDECLRGATMTTLNSFFDAGAASLHLTITVLNAYAPADMTHIGDTYLPLTGASFMWQMTFDILTAAGPAALASFILPIMQDLQNTVDSTEKLYLMVVPADVTKHIVNASSLYAAYSIWSYPSNPDPASAATLEAKAMTTPLAHFSAFVRGLKTTFPALDEYADLIPDPVKTWTPLLPDPNGGSSSGDDDVVVTGYVTGNYLLTFAGEVVVWDRSWTTQRAAVEATIVAAAEARLLRRQYRTTATVVSADTVQSSKKSVSGLQVVCHVTHGYPADATHIWGPNDIASMLLQGNYSATQMIYTAAALSTAGTPTALVPRLSVVALGDTTVAAGALASTEIEYDYTVKILPVEIGLIVMAAAVFGLAMIAFFIACGCFCCCRHCISTNKHGNSTRARGKAERTPQLQADLERDQRRRKNLDADFASDEDPYHVHKKHRKGTRSPNPLCSHDEHRALGPREEDEQETQQLRTTSLTFSNSDNSDPVKKVPPLPIAATEGVPMDLTETPVTPGEDHPHRHYYDATPDEQAADAVVDAAVVSAPPQEEEKHGGGRPQSSRHMRHRGKRAAAAEPPRQSTPPRPEAGNNYTQQYMALVDPTLFFSTDAPDPCAAGQEEATEKQTRLSQNSLLEAKNAAALPPAAYPQLDEHHLQYQQQRYHHRYSASPPPAYPSAELYAGAPVPTTTTSLSSFMPMLNIRKKN
ncbi:hypothetical protein ABB37_02108 [Leptomonas pyrrhocoris]|uniref:Transmembrane protein n=1 Tax=Leptomonas pyrrhocoris TaxID=157538 RepID=A0A0M9G7I0_LEPPY|nr:hypothetical protein ABB37_02108 [Leptomonas pyrrhocoris]XP_015662397.1 hypothetical protein ABB37_02108 [Leptomonas pyrrhocoris]XP_015662398.1 hypothetical protein ABB37_02108 [Leptomonas pyrrhocoris]KPA83957.1 hypothetical protein ABB37_02108 [Leptomonas pyrrhocoris]KPA83958.1 hypothetical protein ABB37_02108 [Leptomonas pyrrhocoris]KPA83959.1 hypothetical protein ABB37_02108 [Leptomonas pyrrhocoris]|eukprot:XP_015662396.1 hypothetical protein ABB37_02108 [Leptomonas pyrrhocoris]